MGLFTKKVTLEDFVQTIVWTAFEYPSDKNIKAVDIDNLLSNNEVNHLKECIPSFILAVNFMLVVLSAEQGAIKRFKGDTSYEVSKTMGFALVFTVGSYLENEGLSKEQAANNAEAICDVAIEYLQDIEENNSEYPKTEDIFIGFCEFFRNRVVGKVGKDNHEKAFIVFDFAKQLYCNISEGFESLKID